jgi:hypothetical protein
MLRKLDVAARDPRLAAGDSLREMMTSVSAVDLQDLES